MDSGKPRLTVNYGIKGGRLSETSVINTEQVFAAIITACQIVAERHGRLIDLPELKTAMNYYHYHLLRLGLTGWQASQSLSNGRAQDSLNWNRQQSAGYK